MSLRLDWTVLHIFEWKVLLDTKLISLRCALCFLVFLFKEFLDFFFILIKPVYVCDILGLGNLW